MGEIHPHNDIVCIQKSCFFLPFFEVGAVCTQDVSPWEAYKQGNISPDQLKSIALFTKDRIERCSETMAFLMKIHPDWDITPHDDGVYMGTDALRFEDLLPKLSEAGFTGADFVIYSEYMQKWGMFDNHSF